MATETKEKTETNVEASAKCVSMIQRIDKNSAEGASLKIQLANLALSEASRCGYTEESEVRKMLALSWREARGFKSSDETLQNLFDQQSRPDVSKIMRLAYPVKTAVIEGKTVEPAKELEKAVSHNEKVGARRDRIGENSLLNIARETSVSKMQKLAKQSNVPRVHPARSQVQVHHLSPINSTMKLLV